MKPDIILILFLSISLSGCTQPPTEVGDTPFSEKDARALAAAACDAGNCTYERCLTAEYPACEYFACGEGEENGTLASWHVDLVLSEPEGSRAFSIPTEAACASVSIIVEGIHPDAVAKNYVDIHREGELVSRCEVASSRPAVTSCEGRLPLFPGNASVSWHIIGASSLDITFTLVSPPKV